jgi:hypothetical protein
MVGHWEDLSVTPALAGIALRVAMILPPFGAWWRAAIGLAALQGESLLAAVRAAIALSTLTTTAEMKRRAASGAVANAQPEDKGNAVGHRSPQGGLESRGRSGR